MRKVSAQLVKGEEEYRDHGKGPHAKLPSDPGGAKSGWVVSDEATARQVALEPTPSSGTRHWPKDAKENRGPRGPRFSCVDLLGARSF